MYNLVHPVIEGKFMEKKVTSPLDNNLFRTDSETSTHFEFTQLNKSIQEVPLETMKRIAEEFKRSRKYIQEDFQYNVDKLLYKGTVICLPESYNGNKWMSFKIKLSNDGFLYSAPDTFKNILYDNIERHNHDNWCFLTNHEANQLRAGKTIAIEILGAVDKTQLFYNEHINRVDLKYINQTSKDSLCITFEPGYSEVSFDDIWLE